MDSHNPSVETSKQKNEDDDADFEEDDDELYKDEFWYNSYNKDVCLSHMKQNHRYLPPDYVLQSAILAGCVPELLESEECSVFRPYYYLSTEIDRLIQRDDKDKFASFLITNHDLILKFGPPCIFKGICIKGAAACAAAFLESPFRTSLDDKHTYATPFSLQDAFYTALGSFHFDLFKVLYLHGAGPYPERYLLVLVLSTLSRHRLLQNWIPNDSPKSFLKLIHMFCSPELKQAHDVITLLASHTKQLEGLCLEFIQNGKIISLAALLIASRDRLLMPSFEGGNLKDTPIMHSILEVLQQNLMHEGFNSEKWVVGLNFIHALWMARHVLDRYCSSEPSESFDFASDLIRHVGVLHESESQVHLKA